MSKRKTDELLPEYDLSTLKVRSVGTGWISPYIEERTEEFIRGISANCTTHDDWLALMRFGIQFFTDKQSLLLHLIILEAERELVRENKNLKVKVKGKELPKLILVNYEAPTLHGMISNIFDELDLSLAIGVSSKLRDEP